MSIYEYNEEYVRKSFYEDGMADGYEDEHADGCALTLLRTVESAMKNLGMNPEQACQALDIPISEYRQAKKSHPAPAQSDRKEGY